MIIKLTLCGLIIVLIAVLAISYYMNKEGFDDIPVQATGKFLIEMEAADGNGDDKGNSSDGAKSDDKKRRDPKASRHHKKGPPAGMPQTGVTPSDPFNFDDMMSPMNGAVPTMNTVTPQVKVSDDSYAAMLLKQKSEILQDLQKIVRNEILAQRSTNPVDGSRDKSRASDTHSTAQGKEYSRKNHKRDDSCDMDDSDCDHPNGYKPHPTGYNPNKCNDCDKPDMREYIRKDSIPCMNCNLDY